MTNIIGDPQWSSVRVLESNELALGGINGNMNEQAKALVERTEYLKETSATKAEVAAIGGGNYGFNTVADFEAVKNSIPSNSVVTIGDQGSFIWDGIVLTPSPYDPLQLMKNSLNEKISYQNEAEYTGAWVDEKGNLALAIKGNGVVYAPKFVSKETNNMSIETIDHPEYVEVKTDAVGNIVFGIKKDGSVDIPKLITKQQSKNYRTLAIGSDDSIIHIGDSMTASHYCVQDKSYICQLSQLSPYRHINYGVSGNDLLNMQTRVLKDVQTFGASLKTMKPRFAFIASFANDSAFTGVDLSYYQENTRRLIDICLAHGVQPVLISYFLMNSTQHQSVKSISDEYKIPLIWNDVLNKQVGFYDGATLFHQWHTGTRNGGLWWLPMLEYIQQQTPMRTLKVFRKRPGFNVTADAELLFKSNVDKAKKWKEITVGHYSLANEYKYDELDTLGASDLTWTLREDEYVKISNKNPINFTDYSLIEIGLDALQKHLLSIEINLSVTGNTAFFVRNNLDKTVELPKVPPTDPSFQNNWNKPRGKWRQVDLIDGKITINKEDIIFSMVGNKIFLMIKGNFNLSDISVNYQAEKYENSLPTLNNVKQKLGAELLSQPLLGSSQLVGWKLGGTVSSIVPIDISNAPRKPDLNTAVDGVVTLTPSNFIEQSIVFPSCEEVRTFKVVVWARYFPKAFLDITNPKYASLDPSQIVDRNQPGVLQPINKDSLDIQVLKLETWAESTKPNSGGADHFDFVGMQWRPVVFNIEVQPYTTNLTINLKAEEGSIQVAKVSVKEAI
ncbi:hypothetical protein MMP64_08340 [Acinetobacter sp. ANC 5659]|uniref:SGNH/GDSL hydrolase family protein n=1 Tax=Acinetobacter higginsii TaxID=70347 RepID=UPI001F4B2003|nr:hypothetical protein [Acinetobacter higginsii]MCH7317947.1 hypothetical protein [Acinetobacter higginsii]